MAKNKKGANSKGTVTSKEEKLYISRHFLAGFYGLNEKKLLFAVSEISCGDADVYITPVIAVIGSDIFIDLKAGDCKRIANAVGFKQDLYPAIVAYDAKESKFVFKSSIMTTVEITVSELQNAYGKSVINNHII